MGKSVGLVYHALLANTLDRTFIVFLFLIEQMVDLQCINAMAEGLWRVNHRVDTLQLDLTNLVKNMQINMPTLALFSYIFI